MSLKTYKTKLKKAESAVPKVSSFASGWQTKLNNTMSDIENRKPFSYDFNADQLYQQYKDNYTKQANMAMQNTMANAAAQSGGYGNSYASTAGNLAYQNEMSNLNNVIPQLYEQAYNKYNTETSDLYNQLNAQQGMYGNDMDKFNLNLSTALSNRDYAAGQYQNAWNNNMDTKQFNWNKKTNTRDYKRGVVESDRSYNLQKTESDRSYALQKAASARATANAKKSSGTSGTKTSGVTYSDALSFCKTYAGTDGDSKLKIASYLANSGLSQEKQDYLWKVTCGYDPEEKATADQQNKADEMYTYTLAYLKGNTKAKKDDNSISTLLSYEGFRQAIPYNQDLQEYGNYADYIKDKYTAAKSQLTKKQITAIDKQVDADKKKKKK